MTLDPLLQAVMKRAEFDRVKLVEQISQHNIDHPLDVEFKRTMTSNFLWAADKENSRIMPIIKGLCEEVQRLRNSVEGIFTLLDDQILVRNINDDKDIMKFMQQGMRLTAHINACKSALCTSSLEKLGGEG